VEEDAESRRKIIEKFVKITKWKRPLEPREEKFLRDQAG
jgi:hypothetical protein